MNKKHTFWSLCNEYQKIEIPIIQRDYAQGRNTTDVQRIRDKFINEFLIDSILNGMPVELDFVYGSVTEDSIDNSKKEVFIPLDGQQRLTTLFLLHYYIAVKDKCVDDYKKNLLKFTYETRPTAHDFIHKMIQLGRPKNLENIKAELLDSDWFNPEWGNDPTVNGMLTMLDTFSRHRALNDYPKGLFDKLINIDVPLVSFYFIPLERFGLTENLYIRMNARGKMLNDFENFKSEFFKIVAPFHDLHELIKDKIEYKWVENLWDFRETSAKGEDLFLVDKPFMSYLNFITDMLYMKDAEFRAASYETDFLDFKLLRKVYAKKENVEFLIYAFDSLAFLNHEKSKNILWENATTIHHILSNVINGKYSTLEAFILFSALKYRKRYSNNINLFDFIRVVRNLMQNTADSSRREWPRLISSIENLIAEMNVYEIIADVENSKLLEGFYVAQRKEEVFKAKLIKLDPHEKETIFKVEDNPLLKGNIEILLAGNYETSEKRLHAFKIEDANVKNFDFSKFKDIYSIYQEISNRDFNVIWGDLLISSLYSKKPWGRLIYEGDYKKHPAVISFALDYIQSGKKNLEEYKVEKRKAFVKSMLSNFESLELVRNPKYQLYLYYIIHTHIFRKSFVQFFKNGYNFGWLAPEPGFLSLYKAGIENDNWFSEINPIFQTYSSQFRYNCGLKTANALDIEIVDSDKKNNAFQLLEDWANS